jgi:uncharacterized protein (TIGR03435 family)
VNRLWVPLLGLLVGGVAAAVEAQTPPPAAFTAASIKRNLSGGLAGALDVRPGGRLSITNESLRWLLRIAFQVQDGQLIGGPDWLATDRWDIVATADAQVSEFAMIGMLRELVLERFRIKWHRDTREIPVYALVVAPGGLRPDFRRSDNDCKVRTTCGQNRGPGEFRGTGQTLGSIRRVFEQVSGRVVVDRTGLAALTPDNVAVFYDITLRWRPDGVGDVNSDRPSLFTAIEEQLGLRLQADRSAVDVVVIDAAERAVE